jgi:hypothetical protein
MNAGKWCRRFILIRTFIKLQPHSLGLHLGSAWKLNRSRHPGHPRLEGCRRQLRGFKASVCRGSRASYPGKH